MTRRDWPYGTVLAHPDDARHLIMFIAREPGDSYHFIALPLHIVFEDVSEVPSRHGGTVSDRHGWRWVEVKS